MGTGRDLYAVRGEGERFPVEIGLNPIEYNGEDCVLCSIVDISERKRHEKQLIKLNKSLERSNQELEEFTYIASHDLKEPLRGIHNYSMILHGKYASLLDSEGVAKLETLPKLTQRLERQIDSLLVYSRINKKDLNLSVADLSDVIHDAMTMVKIRLDEKGFNVKVGSDLPKVSADKVRLTEVFSNLFSNAIKYNESD